MPASSGEYSPISAPLNRRAFLGKSLATAAAFPTLAAFLDACSSSPTTAAPSSSAFTVASPANPVTWPISSTNPAIADNLVPEQNAIINIYTYTSYLDPAALKSFEKKYAKYNVKCLITTFESTSEAIGKIRSGGIQADIYNPSYDQMGRMVKGDLIQPLNHTYISNISNVWPSFTNPFYDQEWRYSVPYTVYTTGIVWRTDKVSEDVAARTNPYDVFWDPQYSKRLSVLDDYRTAMGLVAMRAGWDINTADPTQIAGMHEQLTKMNQATSPKVNVTDYQDIPTKVVDMCQAWSGDAFNMVSYMPTGQSPDVLRYWFPTDPHNGEVDNDMLVLLKMSKYPVMAHLFINHMLDYKVARANFMFTGYQMPQTLITPSNLVSDGTIPKNLASVVVEESLFAKGQRLLELPPAIDAQWQAVWSQFKAGA